ncbi:DUF58 domain-containing protein [Phenylobacterium kunshanense]|uniref:DUF58 domain-containing protein n=1 Tax=Phenylobacterium kunshanense TaxID=1445034 RepID=A0A328BDQ9_9CAUL|nr:DUF58 domain-containing protein [Phenylobacterium kunshanense]RAK64785.1 DUF58 domain-containing protein [Phenylobacterium kunshanense]
MAAGAAPALAVAMIAPGLWTAAAAWIVLAVGLMLADALLATPPRRVTLEAVAPRVMGVGRADAMRLVAAFEGRAPGEVELAVGVDARLNADPERAIVRTAAGRAEREVRLSPLRRGEGRIEGVWARWRGPLGLVWVQRQSSDGPSVAVTPDVAGVKEQALRLFAPDAPLGAKPLLDVGEGSDFHALKEFQTGMDLGDIDWKQSARHGKLVGREYRTERNHHVLIALDTGRLMSAPTAGLPRIDRAINAALLLAFASLRMGDRVGLFAFDSRPRLASGLASGPAAFPLLQKLAASIDYSTEETNFTLGLTALAGRLDRRAMVVIFTDFADATSAELMVENVARLMRTHLVLFVVFRDEELETLVAKRPESPEDVSRAVVADRLLKQREAVSARLRRLGAQIVDAPAEALPTALLNGYLDVKRRGLI